MASPANNSIRLESENQDYKNFAKECPRTKVHSRKTSRCNCLMNDLRVMGDKKAFVEKNSTVTVTRKKVETEKGSKINLVKFQLGIPDITKQHAVKCRDNLGQSEKGNSPLNEAASTDSDNLPIKVGKLLDNWIEMKE